MKTEITISTPYPEPYYIHLAAMGAPEFDIAVQFADQASQIFSTYREEYGFGASDMKRRCGNIYNSRNQLVGRISYNGRIWKEAHRETQGVLL